MKNSKKHHISDLSKMHKKNNFSNSVTVLTIIYTITSNWARQYYFAIESIDILSATHNYQEINLGWKFVRNYECNLPTLLSQFNKNFYVCNIRLYSQIFSIMTKQSLT